MNHAWPRDLLMGTKLGYLTAPLVYSPTLVGELGIFCPWLLSLALVSLLVAPITGGSVLWMLWAMILCLFGLGIWRWTCDLALVAVAGNFYWPYNWYALILESLLPVGAGVAVTLLPKPSFPATIPWGFILGSLATLVFSYTTIWRLIHLLPQLDLEERLLS